MSTTGSEDTNIASEKNTKVLENLAANAGKAVDDTFLNVMWYLDAYANRTGDDRPLRLWVSNQRDWTHHARESRELAQWASINYQAYNAELQRLQNTGNMEEMERAKVELEFFYRRNAAHIPTSSTDSFLALSGAVSAFTSVFPFPELGRDCDFIATSLQQFAEILRGLSSQASFFESIVDATVKATSPAVFRSNIQLARDVAMPIFLGLGNFLASMNF